MPGALTLCVLGASAVNFGLRVLPASVVSLFLKSQISNLEIP